MKKVLVPNYLKNILDTRLKKNNFQPVYLKNQMPNTILKGAPDIFGAILQSKPFPGKLMAKLPNLKVAARFGVGYDSVDLNYAAKHHIWVTNTPGANSKSVAESTVANILILAEHLYSTSNAMRGIKSFANYPSETLAGKTVGVIGFGHIARKVIKILSSFDVNILIYDKFQKKFNEQSKYGKFVDWDTLFKKSDYVTLHIPAVSNTIHCVSAKEFKMMKPSAFIVNFARGALINQQDMVNALKQHEIKGAALDVFEKEPLPKDSELRNLPNVFLTPHCAGKTVQSSYKMANVAADQVIEVAKGQKPDYPVVKFN